MKKCSCTRQYFAWDVIFVCSTEVTKYGVIRWSCVIFFRGSWWIIYLCFGECNYVRVMCYEESLWTIVEMEFCCAEMERDTRQKGGKRRWGGVGRCEMRGRTRCRTCWRWWCGWTQVTLSAITLRTSAQHCSPCLYTLQLNCWTLPRYMCSVLDYVTEMPYSFVVISAIKIFFTILRAVW